MILAIAAVVVGFASSYKTNMIRVRSPKYYSDSLAPSLLFDHDSFVSRMIEEQRAITRSMLDLVVDHQFWIGDQYHQQQQEEEDFFPTIPRDQLIVDDDSEVFQLTVDTPPALEAEDDIDVTFNTDDGVLIVR